MKNATKYAETLRGVLKSCLKEGKPNPPQHMDPLKALVRGAMSYDIADTRVDEVMKMVDREFVNLNELRVATDLEVQELVGAKYPAIEQRVQMLTSCLNAIFEKEHTLSLDRLRTINKKDARQYLRDLPQMHPFVEAYVMIFAFEAPAMPVDQEILTYLREELGIFDEKTALEDAQRFIEHNMKAEELYDLFACLRRAVYSENRKAKKKK